MTLDPANYTTIDIEKRADGVAIATLNRPEKLNAVNAAMHRDSPRCPSTPIATLMCGCSC